MPSVGERIKKRRNELGWTQDVLAEKAGVSKSFLSDLENGKRNVGADTLLEIARALSLSLDYLMEGKEVEPERHRSPDSRCARVVCRSGRHFVSAGANPARNAAADHRPPQQHQEGKPGQGGLAEVLRSRQGFSKMSRLDQEHDVIALARELGLRGDPVEAVVRFCEEKIGCWAADFGAVESVAALEQLVADRLQLVFEEVCSDDDLERIIAKYVAQGEYVFATLRDELGPTTFGLTIKRKHCGPELGDKYVAVIDCRGDKATRRFFTRWHEVAHLLVLEKELDALVRRSSHDPIERLMDEIAGRIGFYEPLFGPVFAREHRQAPLEFKTVEAIRNDLL